MRYGLDASQFWTGLKIFVAIAVLACIAAVAQSLITGNETRNYGALVFLLIAVPSIWLIFSTFFFATSVTIDNDEVRWYLFDRWLLKRVPVQQVRGIRGGSFSAVIIETDSGNLRVIGLHLPNRRALSDHLKGLNPEIRVG